jgi:tetraacyldisaccharide 4'-kinase
LPFSLCYWLAIGIRNWLYDKKILRTTSFGLPIICIGNLSLGGTGKSPMVEFLLEKLQHTFRVATLSRGYKRKTRGYALAMPGSTALDIGDEPMQFHIKFPDVPVAVGEKRIEAIPQLLHDHPETQAIILDDAFQHRKIKPGLNILLTEYNNLFTHDFYLPTGDLRDLKRSYRRAEMIVVTKCLPDLTQEERKKTVKDIAPRPNQQVFFTMLEYGTMYHIATGQDFAFPEDTEVLLVSGIANPRPLERWLESNHHAYHLMKYGDHHIFTIDDLKEIERRFGSIDAAKKIILTTEKDAVRLEKFKSRVASLPMFVIPVRHRFLFEEEPAFMTRVVEYIQQFKRNT